MLKIKRKSNKKMILAIGGGLLVIILGYFAFGYISKSLWPFYSSSSSQTEPRGVNDVDYSPPSAEDSAGSQTGKNNVTGVNENSQQIDKKTDIIPVAVSFAEVVGSNVEVRAFLPTIIEGNGTCTAKFTKDGLVVNSLSEAFIDATSTQCEPIYIAKSEFPENGEWTLIVSYQSSTVQGSSEQLKVKV